MNALTGFVEGMGAAQGVRQMRGQNALAGALRSGDMGAARNALIDVNPMAAYQAMQPDPAAQREAAAGLVRGVLAVDPQMRPQAWSQALAQAQAFGLDVSGVPGEYPGDEYATMLGGMLGLGDAERTEFERLMSVLPPDQARQALMVRLGLAPGADAALRVGAERRGPTFRAATPEEAAAYGAQAGQVDEATGRFYPATVPQGMTVESDGAGGFRMVQGPASAQPQRPFTEGQSKDVVYATRAEGALSALEPLAENLASIGNRALDMDPTGLLRGRMQSPDYQMARNAADEFLQAILRKDTGAAITAQEQELYGRTYLPMPGDGPEVLAFKAQARRRAIDALRAGMSPAQMIAVERGLAGGEAPQAAPAQPAADAPAGPPEGVDPADWEFLTPEERALFQ